MIFATNNWYQYSIVYISLYSIENMAHFFFGLRYPWHTYEFYFKAEILLKSITSTLKVELYRKTPLLVPGVSRFLNANNFVLDLYYNSRLDLLEA
jgi:hypothetical protein